LTEEEEEGSGVRAYMFAHRLLRDANQLLHAKLDRSMACFAALRAGGPTGILNIWPPQEVRHQRTIWIGFDIVHREWVLPVCADVRGRGVRVGVLV
jgi:hypothetical protein